MYVCNTYMCVCVHAHACVCMRTCARVCVCISVALSYSSCSCAKLGKTVPMPTTIIGFAAVSCCLGAAYMLVVYVLHF